MPLISYFPSAGGREIKYATGTISPYYLNPRNTITVTGLDFTPVIVVVTLESGNNLSNVEIAAASNEFSKFVLTKGSSKKATSIDLIYGGFTIVIPEEWGWSGAKQSWHAYGL